MRKLVLILCLMTALTASKSYAQEYEWSGWFIGASGDVFWNQPAEQMFAKPRLQFSKILQVGGDPKILSMPGLAWSTAVGEVAPELNIYHQFLTHGHWEFLAGVGGSPVIIKTAQGGEIADKGAIMVDLLARYKLSDKFGVIGGLKANWVAPYKAESTETGLGTIMTFTLGIQSDVFGF